MKVRWLERRIAKPGPFLALCLSEPEYRLAVRHLKIDEPPRWLNHGADATAHVFESGRGLVCLICLGDCKSRTPIEIAGLLVHEAVHVWQHYAEEMGEHRPGAEQEAYAIQSISQELMAEYARRIS